VFVQSSLYGSNEPVHQNVVEMSSSIIIIIIIIQDF